MTHWAWMRIIVHDTLCMIENYSIVNGTLGIIENYSTSSMAHWAMALLRTIVAWHTGHYWELLDSSMKHWALLRAKVPGTMGIVENYSTWHIVHNWELHVLYSIWHTGHNWELQCTMYTVQCTVYNCTWRTVQHYCLNFSWKFSFTAHDTPGVSSMTHDTLGVYISFVEN